jgi:clostripain
MRTSFLACQQVFAIALALLVAPGAFADTKAGQAKRPWTILLYGAVDNSADDPFVAFTDQVRRAIDDDPGIELILLIDRSDKHTKRTTFLGEDFHSTRLYRVRKDSVERLSGGTHFPELTTDKEVKLNSADAMTLQRFIAWGKANYPAERYGLLIYSHADGQTMCPADRAGDDMGIAEVTDKIGKEGRVDFLALELCNMGGLEIAYQWRPGNGRFEADVLLAIPNAGPPLDWHRAFGRIRSPGHAPQGGTAVDPAQMTAADFGKLVIEEGRRGREEADKRRKRASKEAAGCYDLRKAGDVKKAVDALAAALAKSDAKSVVLELRNARAENRLINYSEDGSYVDLYGLCRRVAGCQQLPEPVRAAATQVMKSIEGFMIGSFGMGGYQQFEAGKHGVFIVLPSGRPNCWKHFRWYTPRKEGKNQGNWSFLQDGATPGNGVTENWYELLESWFNVPDEQNGSEVAPGAKEEMDKLQGEWTMTAMEQRGQKATVRPTKLTITGNQWTVTSSAGQGSTRQWTFKVDPSKEPKTIDLTTKVGKSEHVALGIYKLEGDTLTLCRAMATGDVERPREFKSNEEEGMLIVWKRVAK